MNTNTAGGGAARAADPGVTIREFQPGDEPAFLQLNLEWICRYFSPEPKDLETIEHPVPSILDPGGRIFFAIREGKPVGCCALLATGPGQYEVAKMTVTETSRGSGIGRRLLTAVIAEARASGAARLYLETNHILTPAIRLYESLGFRHIPPVPSRYARADVFMELRL